MLSVCPHCGAKHKFADDSQVGKKVRCRECEEPFAVQQANAAAGKRPAKKSAGGGSPPGGLPPRTVGVKSKSKKKKPKSADAEPKKKPRAKSSAGKSPALIGIVSVLGLALLIGVPLLFFGKKEPMKPPESYDKFSHSKEQTFKCEYPSGWTVESGGGQSGAPPWAKFIKGDVKIQVKSSMGMSAIGDIAKNTGGMSDGETAEERAPVATVHNLTKEKFAPEYGDYKESAPKAIETGFGDTRVSEFTGTSGFSDVRGMRASMLGLNLQYTVICDCPEEDWDVCRPIFERVIKSMSRG